MLRLQKQVFELFKKKKSVKSRYERVRTRGFSEVKMLANSFTKLPKITLMDYICRQVVWPRQSLCVKKTRVHYSRQNRWLQKITENSTVHEKSQFEDEMKARELGKLQKYYGGAPVRDLRKNFRVQSVVSVAAFIQ